MAASSAGRLLLPCTVFGRRRLSQVRWHGRSPDSVPAVLYRGPVGLPQTEPEPDWRSTCGAVFGSGDFGQIQSYRVRACDLRRPAVDLAPPRSLVRSLRHGSSGRVCGIAIALWRAGLLPLTPFAAFVFGRKSVQTYRRRPRSAGPAAGRKFVYRVAAAP